MYKCPNCHEIYDEPDVRVFVADWLDGFPRNDYEEFCPFCGEIHHADSEVFECEKCGEYFYEHERARNYDDRVICKDCWSPTE